MLRLFYSAILFVFLAVSLVLIFQPPHFAFIEPIIISLVTAVGNGLAFLSRGEANGLAVVFGAFIVTPVLIAFILATAFYFYLPVRFSNLR